MMQEVRTGRGLAVLVAILVSPASGGPGPPQYYVAGASVPDMRTDLCNRSSAVEQGDVELSESLAGLTLQFQAYVDDRAAIDYDVTLGWSGLHYEIASAVAEAGGFDFEISLRIASETNATTEDMARHNDAALSLTIMTPELAADGFVSLTMVDASPVLVAKKDDDSSTKTLAVKLLQFSEPLGWELWVALGCFMVATVLAYAFVERRSKFVGATTVCRSSLHVSGVGGMEARTLSGRLLLATWGFVLIAFVASYVANFAAMRAERTCDDENDSAAAGAYAASDVVATCDGRDGIALVEAVDAGECEVAIVDTWSYHVARCTSVKTVGSSLYSAGAGWLAYPDGAKCTFLLYQVFARYLLALEASGKLDALARDYVDATPALDCASSSSSSTSSARPLQLQQLLGVLALHALSIVGALVVGLWALRREKSPLSPRWERRRFKQDDIDDYQSSARPVRECLIHPDASPGPRVQADLQSMANRLGHVEASLETIVDLLVGNAPPRLAVSSESSKFLKKSISMPVPATENKIRRRFPSLRTEPLTGCEDTVDTARVDKEKKEPASSKGVHRKLSGAAKKPPGRQARSLPKLTLEQPSVEDEKRPTTPPSSTTRNDQRLSPAVTMPGEETRRWSSSGSVVAGVSRRMAI